MTPLGVEESIFVLPQKKLWLIELLILKLFLFSASANLSLDMDKSMLH